MNIYFCNDEQTTMGCFIAAETRGKAKAIYAPEYECNYLDIRVRITKKDIEETEEGVISDTKILDKYGIEYRLYDEERNGVIYHIQTGKDTSRNHAQVCEHYTEEPYNRDEFFVL